MALGMLMRYPGAGAKTPSSIEVLHVLWHAVLWIFLLFSTDDTSDTGIDVIKDSIYISVSTCLALMLVCRNTHSVLPTWSSCQMARPWSHARGWIYSSGRLE